MADRNVQPPQSAPALGRQANMINGADLLQAQAQQLASSSATPLLDFLRYPGRQAASFLSNGLSQMQRGVNDTINSSPTLSGVKKFLSDFGGALSNAAATSPAIPQAFHEVQQTMPDALRQVQGQR